MVSLSRVRGHGVRGHSKPELSYRCVVPDKRAVVSWSCTVNVIATCPKLPTKMRRSNQPKSIYPQLECVTRISNIPIVESGWNMAENIYTRIKNSNSLMYWTLGRAEVSFNTALEMTVPPTVAIFGGPINTIDKILCRSLDVVEQRVPNIHLPPNLMYWQTKEYVNTTFVKPVLKRADSVKQIGNSVLESKYTSFAAHKLDSALSVADMYVDKYLPDAIDQALDEAESTRARTADESALPAVQTIHHVDRFSRKLQRRLTKRTLVEAKALKARSQESIHVLLYVAELIATDPKQAVAKARELWDTLSQNEPENQARPQTLEQLIVMLTRESARRVVHFVNFTRSAVGKLPVTISRGVHFTSEHCRLILDNLVKSIHLEELTNAATDTAKVRASRMTAVFQELNSFANLVLERLALSIAGHSDSKSPAITSPTRHHHRHSNQQNQVAPSPQPQPVAQPQRNNHHGHHGNHGLHGNHGGHSNQAVLVQPAAPAPVATKQYRVQHRYTNSVLNGAQVE